MPRGERYDEADALTARYAGMMDGELLELRGDFDDLTDVAQDCLRKELQQRKLWSDALAEDEGRVLPLPGVADGETGPEGVDLEVAGTSVCECDSTVQGELLCYALGLDGIPAVIYRPEARYVSVAPQIRVAPADVERALALLARGIPDRVVKDFEDLPAVADFQEPPCPKCGAKDALLESVDPVNQWLCESCATRWSEDDSPAE